MLELGLCGPYWVQSAAILRAKPMRQQLFPKQHFRVTQPSCALFVPPATSGRDAGQEAYRGFGARL